MLWTYTAFSQFLIIWAENLVDEAPWYLHRTAGGWQGVALALIVLQFGFFLLLGLCLFAFYGGATLQQLGLKSSDEIFPKYIVENLPTGLAGLVVAGVLASAMGTLSSSISSLASATYLDLFRSSAKTRNLSPQSEIFWSRAFTLFWGVVLIGGALLFTDTRNPVVEVGLKIASFTYGGLLGVFFLGLLFPRATQRDAYAGFIAGLVQQVLQDHPQELSSYLAGKETLSAWFFGQVMRSAKGQANPQVLRAELDRQLSTLKK